MTETEFKERVDFLLTLTADHPSYIRYLDSYQNYLVEHQADLGLEYTTEMQQRLPRALFRRSKDKNVVLQDAINDLEKIRRSGAILLNRLPLSSYLFAREIASGFMKEIKPQSFVDPNNRGLIIDNTFYRTKLAEFFAVLKSSKDVFGFYSKFRKILLTYLVNNILLPENVAPYRKLVAYLENRIDETNRFLNKINETGEAHLMNSFGDSSQIYKAGDITGAVLLDLMDGGISYVLKMKKSSDPVEQEIGTNLLNQAAAFSGEPLHDFVYGKEHKADIIYCRIREEILTAQKVALSILNIYSADLLLKTSWNTVYEIKTYGIQYDRDIVMETTKNNLSLLQQYGVISMETLLKYERQLEHEI